MLRLIAAVFAMVLSLAFFLSTVSLLICGVLHFIYVAGVMRELSVWHLVGIGGLFLLPFIAYRVHDKANDYGTKLDWDTNHGFYAICALTYLGVARLIMIVTSLGLITYVMFEYFKSGTFLYLEGSLCLFVTGPGVFALQLISATFEKFIEGGRGWTDDNGPDDDPCDFSPEPGGSGLMLQKSEGVFEKGAKTNPSLIDFGPVADRLYKCRLSL